jgi:hypothetical protein
MKNNAMREAGAVESTGKYAAPAFMIPNIEATASPDAAMFSVAAHDQ